MIRVLIADDHVIVRNGLKKLFEVMGDLEVAGEAANGDAVLQTLQRGEFDLILLDLTMPGLSGVELIERIHATHPSLPILVLSMRNELHVVKRVIHAGIAGYVTKGGSEDQLIDAIRKVADGKRFIDPEIAELIMFENTLNNEPPTMESLSERERQFLMYFAQGMRVTEIAKLLEVSTKSASTYKMRLMKKMGFSNNSELLMYAVEYGLNAEKKV